jgi:hypothetical protein
LSDGDVGAAVVRLQDARQRCRRHTDTYRWVTVHVLDALCGMGVTHHLPDAATWLGELEALALGAGLREQIVRAHRHCAGLGEPAAAASAELLARETDNPALLT